jgi:MFS family permease
VNDTDRVRAALAGIVCAVLFAQVSLYPGLPDLVDALGAPPTVDAAMWFLASEFAAFVAFAAAWGAASDALGRRAPLIAVSGGLGVVGYLAILAAPAVGLPFTGVLVLRALQGAAVIGAFSLALAMLMDLPGGHGRNMGAAGLAIGVGTALGAPVGGQLTGVDPLLPVGIAAGLLGVVAGTASLLPDREAGGGRRLRAVGRAIAQNSDLAVPYVYGFVDRLTAGFFALVGTLYFRSAFGLDAAATGLMLALFFAPFALLQYPLGALSDRTGRFLPIVGGSLAYGVAVAAVGLAPTVAFAGLGMVATGVVGAAMAPATMALVTDLVGEGERGAAIGGFNIAGSVGFLGGILFGGTAAQAWGFEAAFLAVAGLEAAVALATLPAMRRIAGGAAGDDA